MNKITTVAITFLTVAQLAIAIHATIRAFDSEDQLSWAIVAAIGFHFYFKFRSDT